LKLKNSRLKNWDRQTNTQKCNTEMNCMTYELSLSLIPGVVFVVDIGQEFMNIMELVIQVLEPCCAICMMCILCHVQILKLVENHPLKVGICRSSVLRRMINLNGHRRLSPNLDTPCQKVQGMSSIFELWDVALEFQSSLPSTMTCVSP